MARPVIEPAAPVDGSALVRCRGLSIAYVQLQGPPVRVVDRASFDVAPGDALGIVGESGSGKSTLARALLGYRRAGSVFDGGTLHVEGVDVARASHAELSRLRGLRVAMVPQNPLSSLTHHRRVGWQVSEVLRMRAGMAAVAARRRTLELFDEMGLPDPEEMARRYPHQLSGGQRQRVVIAAALACDPALLVLDEPTTALDKHTEAQVLELVLGLKARRGSALVLVTHDLGVVARVCNRVMVMKDGCVLEQGPVAEVFVRPTTDYTRMLRAASLDIVGAPRAPSDGVALAAEDGASIVDVRTCGDPLLDGRAVSFRYRPAGWLERLSKARANARPTLDAVDFAVGRGEVLGIIGESGSGKTTLGLTVAGSMAPESGRLAFDGASIAAIAARRTADTRRRIQMIFQDPLSSLNPRHTVGASIIRPMRLFLGLDQTEARRRAVALLAELGMPESHLARYPRQLSGGQQQRVAIARAFAVEPDLLVCDEITSALDASVQSQVLEQLGALQRQRGTAMLLITHDLAVVRALATRVVVLKDGRVVEHGTTDAVFANPSDPYTRLLLDSARAVVALAPGTATGTASAASSTGSSIASSGADAPLPQEISDAR